MDLCCLQFVGKGLRDIPVGLPNNTILIRFDDGFYTAPDEDDMSDHPHTLAGGYGAALGPRARQSYTYESATRLNNLHECIADTKKSRDEIKHNIDVALSKENAPLIMVNVRSGVACTNESKHNESDIQLLYLSAKAQRRVYGAPMALAATIRS